MDVVLWEPLAPLADALTAELEHTGYNVARATSFEELATTKADVVIGYVRDASDLVHPPRRYRSFIALVEPSLGLAPEIVIALGANAVLERGTPSERVPTAIRAVRAGLVVVDEALRSQISTAQATALARLNDEELPYLRRVAAGETLQEIASDTGNSERTLGRRLSGMYQRLSVADLDEALLLAASAGLIRLRKPGPAETRH